MSKSCSSGLLLNEIGYKIGPLTGWRLLSASALSYLMEETDAEAPLARTAGLWRPGQANRPSCGLRGASWTPTARLLGLFESL